MTQESAGLESKHQANDESSYDNPPVSHICQRLYDFFPYWSLFKILDNK